MDLSVYAGDNFYQYVVGQWIKDNPVPTADEEYVIGTMMTQNKNAMHALAEITAEGKNLIALSLLSLYDHDDMQSDSTLLMSKIKQIDEAGSKEAMLQLMAEFVKQGYPCPFFILPEVLMRQVYPGIEMLREYNLTNSGVERMGISEKEATSIVKAGEEWQAYVKSKKPQKQEKMLSHHYNPHEGVVLINTARRRSAGTDWIGILGKTLDMDLSAIAADENEMVLVDHLMTYNLDALKLLAKYFILNRDCKYLPLKELDAHTEAGANELFQYVFNVATDQSSGLATSLSHSYVKHAIPEGNKAEGTAMFEELRAVFRNRIANYDWMTDVTKGKALEKLDAMKYYCGWPENWHAEWEAKLVAEETSYRLVCNLFNQYVDITRSLVGQTSDDAFFYADWMSMGAYVANAFYSPENNSIALLASNLVSPIYDKTMPHYYNYAVLGATTIGHEMTHGFDNTGSKYNAIGKKENWWTPQDEQNFESRQKLLIDHFNKLQYVPNVYCDGKQTLGENIADLGGIEIAYESYMKNKVTASGGERDYLGREFYRSFAEGWKTNMTSDYAEMTYKTDEHAAPILRVNGIVNLTNEWYRLFNIVDGEMYVAPDKRVSIW
jgi:putative endopeptidase